MKILINFIGLIPLILFTFLACGEDRTLKQQDVSYTYNDDDTIYENAEDGNTSRWYESYGYKIENVKGGANSSERSIFLKENWLRDENGSLATDENGYYTNLAHYELPMDNDYQFILEFDKKRKIMNPSYCFTVGVKLDTQNGERDLSFNTWFDQQKMDPIEQWISESVKELVFPLSTDYINDVGIWKRLRFDLEAYLYEFEPDNRINKVISFYFQGGDDYLDNIRLVSQ